MLSSNVVSEEFVRTILKALQRYEKNEKISWSNECAEVTKSRFDSLSYNAPPCGIQIAFFHGYILLCIIFLTHIYVLSVTVLTLWVAPPEMFCNWYRI